MWEVDPETRSKLQVIQKKEGSGMKGAVIAAPLHHNGYGSLTGRELQLTVQASPKFSTFICLTCAGTHRGLGVHISFVRSISMDAFKQNEILRMQHGGNKAWQDFFTRNSGKPFKDAPIKERYDSEVGEEWKERLTALSEGKEFDKATWSKQRAAILEAQQSRSGTPAGQRLANESSSRNESPARGPAVVPGQKARNETYFAKMGEANSSRPENVPPNQGGKYAGFGSAPPEPQRPQAAMPSAEEFQSDPMAALSKGFGWFSSTVGKHAKIVNESYIQPTAKTITSSDFAAQARTVAAQAGQGIQSGAKGAADSLSRFVEGQDTSGRRAVEPERKDFWDSFGAPSRTDAAKSNSIGTSAMRGGASNPGAKGKEEGWDDW